MTEYLLDTCIVLEIVWGNEKTKLWLNELNPEYIKVAEERIKPYLTQTKLSAENLSASAKKE